MSDFKPLSFHVPAPAVRPGGTPDFSDVPISRAGEVERPPVDVAPEKIRELAFEINVPMTYGLALWEAVYAAGQPFGITPYGTESMHVLRAEKGFIIIGQETDGTATPDDVGLTWAVGKTKPDFVGKRSLARPSMSDPARRQLVGLLASDPNVVLQEGAQIVGAAGLTPPMSTIGLGAMWRCK